MIIKPVDLHSDTFNTLKDDLTMAINVLLTRMQVYNSDEAALTVKLNIDLLKSINDDVLPVFTHKITSTVQIKDEHRGELKGNYALERDAEGLYQLRLLDEQLGML